VLRGALTGIIVDPSIQSFDTYVPAVSFHISHILSKGFSLGLNVEQFACLSISCSRPHLSRRARDTKQSLLPGRLLFLVPLPYSPLDLTDRTGWRALKLPSLRLHSQVSLVFGPRAESSSFNLAFTPASLFVSYLGFGSSQSGKTRVLPLFQPQEGVFQLALSFLSFF
jgi:hypothetical protein